MNKKQRSYISYMLRLQRVHSGEHWIWRASLESPMTGQTHRFEDLRSLISFLETETGTKTPSDEPGPESESI